MNAYLDSFYYTIGSLLSIWALAFVLVFFRNEIKSRSLHEDIILKICIADILSCLLYIIYSIIYYGYFKG